MIVISDNSALSCLAELGELDLLRRLYGEVVIPETVMREACHERAPEALRRLAESPPAWLKVVADPIPGLEETRGLDAGEAAAITLAWQSRESCLLVIDEKKGRRIAAALGLRITGAAGVLTDAATEGWIDFEETFRRMAETGFYLDPAVVAVLRERVRVRRQGGA